MFPLSRPPLLLAGLSLALLIYAPLVWLALLGFSALSLAVVVVVCD